MADRLRFFGPMSLYYLLMTVTHIVVAAGMSRSENSAAALGGYGLAFALGGLANLTAYSVRNLVLVLGPAPGPFRAATRLTVTLASLLVLVHCLIAFTPLGRWIYGGLLGVEGALLTHTLAGYAVMPVTVVAEATRGLLHGRLVTMRRPGVMVVGMVVRLTATAAWVAVAAAIRLEPAALIGTIGMTVAVGAEAAVALWAHLRSPRPAPDDVPPPTPRQAWRLFLPLGGVALITAVGPAVVISALAAGPQPAISLAAFQLSETVAGILIQFLAPLPDVVCLFGRGEGDGRRQWRFCAQVGGVVMLALALLGVPAVGGRVIEWMYGATGALGRETVLAVLTKALYAAAFTVYQFLLGLALLGGNTRAPFFAKSVGLGGALLAAALLPHVGAATGVWVQTAAATCEALLLLWLARIPLSLPFSKLRTPGVKRRKDVAV